MQHFFIIIASLLLTLPSCKKDTKKASTQSTATPSNPSCPVNLSLIEIPESPPNVPEGQMNQLGLDFSVEPVVQGDVTNYYLSITPRPIAPWEGMPSELKDRVADFPRVSICNADNKCLAINSRSQISSQKNAEFDFPFWSGIVSIPADMSGTLTFKARSCTYVRTKSASGQMVPSGNVVCSARQTPASPKEVERAKPNAVTAGNTIRARQLELSIMNLGNYLFPFAQAYLGSLGGIEPASDVEKILVKLAQTIAYDPHQVGAFLASPLYEDFEDSVKEEKGLNLADDPCVASLNTNQDYPGVEPVTPVVNDPNGNLIPQDQTVVTTEVQTQTQTIVQTQVTTQNNTVTVTTNPTSFERGEPYLLHKIRTLDASGNVTGCLQRSADNKVLIQACADGDNMKWNLNPLATTSAAFQVNSQGDKSMCLAQSDKGLLLVKCDMASELQAFRFTASEKVTTAPMIGSGVSSLPYIFVGFQGGKASNCVETTSNTISMANGKAPACSSLFSIDTFNESLSGVQQYAKNMGINKDKATVGTIGTGLVFGGILLGIIGASMYIGGSTYASGVKSSDPNRLKEAKGLKIERLGASAPFTYKFISSDTKVILPDNVKNKIYSPDDLKRLGFDTEKIDTEITKSKTTYSVDNKLIISGTTGSEVLAMKSKSTAPKSPGSKAFKAGGFAVGVIGMVGVIAGSVMWGVSSTSLAEDPKQSFVNALISANEQYVKLKAQLEASPF